MRNYFITGGTGFVGRALVREILAQPDTAQVVCLTRKLRANMLQDDRLSYWVGDVTSAKFPTMPFTDVVHAAAEANDLLAPDKAQYYYDVVEGASRVFNWAEQQRPERLLFVSSGAVLKGDSVYCRAKRMSEHLAPTWATLARIYSLVGPEMPFDGQYALGRFVHQATHLRRVCYYESGSVRSYLHADDCARWLSAILTHGHPEKGAYDVGSEIAVSIKSLAHLVANLAGVPCEEVPRADYHATAQVYLPNLDTTRTLPIDCQETIALAHGIEQALAACNLKNNAA